MKMIDDAVDEMIANLKKNRTWNNVGVRGIVNIRFDIEVADGSDKWVELKRLVQLELEDMVVNGDTAHETDMLLKAFDGEKKTGKSLTAFNVTSAILEEKRAERISTLTLFCKVGPEFEGEVPEVREVAVSKTSIMDRAEPVVVPTM